MFAMFGILGLAFTLLLAPLLLLGTVFWIWMLFHAIINRGLSNTEKIIWVLVVFFLHFIGALLYFLLGRPKGRSV
jgi:hypothetical protein